MEVPKYSSGVIGQHPNISSGSAFRYMSMTFIEDIPGSMEGSFLMMHPKEGTFELPVGPFPLDPDLPAETEI